jgi:hypothetical protein
MRHLDAWQMPFVVRATKGPRQSPFTVQNPGMRPLLCVSEKNAQQRLCHVFFNLCRLLETRGKVHLSRSVL